jgi:quinol monooxygenase YgiN
VIVITVSSSPAGSSRTVTTLCTLGSGQVEQLQVTFVHLLEFADEAAHETHGTSAAVREFEAVYQPELAAGPVVFTDYLLVAKR